MKNLWAGIKLGFKTLVTNPLGYLTNPIKSTTDVYKSELEKSGATMAEIDQAVKAYQESGGLVYDVYKGGSDLAEGIRKTLSFTFRNLPLILILAAVVVVTYYVFMFKKAAA